MKLGHAINDLSSPGSVPDPASKLALALVAMSPVPLLLLDSDLKIVAASASFCQTFGIKPSAIPGAAFAGLGAGEWNVPQLLALLRGTASGFSEGEDYEINLVREGSPTQRLLIAAKRLRYDDAGDIRIML